MKRIAYLGLGIMGSGMATNLLKAGNQVTVWNRSPESCKPLVEKGATQAQTPAQAVENADVIMYCLANDNVVEEVVFGAEGILANVRSGQIAMGLHIPY